MANMRKDILIILLVAISISLPASDFVLCHCFGAVMGAPIVMDGGYTQSRHRQGRLTWQRHSIYAILSSLYLVTSASMTCY